MPRTPKPTVIARYPIAFAALAVLVCGFAYYWFINRAGGIGDACVDQALRHPSVIEAPDEDERVRAIETYYQNCIRNFSGN